MQICSTIHAEFFATLNEYPRTRHSYDTCAIFRTSPMLFRIPAAYTNNTEHD